MTDTLRVACVQLTSTTRIDENIRIADGLVREAHGAGAAFVTLPEVVNLCQQRSQQAKRDARPEAEEPALAATVAPNNSSMEVYSPVRARKDWLSQK